MAKMKFPNPKFFRAKDNVDWKAQGRNLQEVGGIIWDMLKETDWKAFAAKQKANVQDNVRRVVREAKTIAAMTPAERLDLLKTGESTWAPCTARVTWSPCAVSGAAWPTPPMISRNGCGCGVCCWAPSPRIWSRP